MKELQVPNGQGLNLAGVNPGTAARNVAGDYGMMQGKALQNMGAHAQAAVTQFGAMRDAGAIMDMESKLIDMQDRYDKEIIKGLSLANNHPESLFDINGMLNESRLNSIVSKYKLEAKNLNVGMWLTDSSQRANELKNSFVNNLTGRGTGMVFKQQLQRGREAFDNRIRLAAESRDFETIGRVMDEQYAAGFTSPEEYQLGKIKNQKAGLMSALDDAIVSDPDMAFGLLNDQHTKDLLGAQEVERYRAALDRKELIEERNLRAQRYLSEGKAGSGKNAIEYDPSFTEGQKAVYKLHVSGNKMEAVKMAGSLALEDVFTNMPRTEIGSQDHESLRQEFVSTYKNLGVSESEMSRLWKFYETRCKDPEQMQIDYQGKLNDLKLRGELYSRSDNWMETYLNDIDLKEGSGKHKQAFKDLLIKNGVSFDENDLKDEGKVQKLKQVLLYKDKDRNTNYTSSRITTDLINWLGTDEGKKASQVIQQEKLNELIAKHTGAKINYSDVYKDDGRDLRNRDKESDKTLWNKYLYGKKANMQEPSRAGVFADRYDFDQADESEGVGLVVSEEVAQGLDIENNLVRVILSNGRSVDVPVLKVEEGGGNTVKFTKGLASKMRLYDGSKMKFKCVPVPGTKKQVDELVDTAQLTDFEDGLYKYPNGDFGLLPPAEATPVSSLNDRNF